MSQRLKISGGQTRSFPDVWGVAAETHKVWEAEAEASRTGFAGPDFW